MLFLIRDMSVTPAYRSAARTIGKHVGGSLENVAVDPFDPLAVAARRKSEEDFLREILALAMPGVSVNSPGPLRNRLTRLAERVGFEPTVRLPVRRISSAVLSTTQPPLRLKSHWPGDCRLRSDAAL